MVTVNVSKKRLLEKTGRRSDADLFEAMHQIKCPVDCEQDGNLIVEVTGDRPDLLSVEGIARNLRGYFGKETGLAKNGFANGKLEVVCDANALKLRPVVVGAVADGLKLTDERVKELFEFQEKLDLTNGRRRKKASIGLYDMAKLKPPFFFKALDADKTKFIPLKGGKEMSLNQILKELDKGREYAHLLNGMRKMPCLVDSAGEVLSLVPIINGESSAVTSGTRSIFVDHTGTDFSACNASLNIVCAHFADLGAKVTKVKITAGGKGFWTPDDSPIEMNVGVEQVNKMLGLKLSAKQIADCLGRQRIGAKVDGDNIKAGIPAYRADFLHPADLVEEIALGYGYAKFEPLAPSVYTKGGLSEGTLNENFVRDFLVGASFLEVYTHVLTNEGKIKKAQSGEELVEIANPVSSEYSVMRATVYPNLLDVLSKNSHNTYPQDLFEVGETVLFDGKEDVKMRTVQKACAVLCGPSANLSKIASVLSELCGKIFSGEKIEFVKNDFPQFIAGRSAAVLVGGKKIGFVGEASPVVLENFGLQMPVALFEVEI
ncbi:phenylalanine--tRNA ligase subunit beta [Candidatus Micrarchaeota archaeon]|nr:phenylalanine--tRNA ligase subunit beta [Candidatus Micrarchaeota archaeon]